MVSLPPAAKVLPMSQVGCHQRATMRDSATSWDVSVLTGNPYRSRLANLAHRPPNRKSANADRWLSGFVAISPEGVTVIFNGEAVRAVSDGDSAYFPGGSLCSLISNRGAR